MLVACHATTKSCQTFPECTRCCSTSHQLYTTQKALQHLLGTMNINLFSSVKTFARTIATSYFQHFSNSIMCQLESMTQTRVCQTLTSSLLLSCCHNHIVCTVGSYIAMPGQALLIQTASPAAATNFGACWTSRAILIQCMFIAIKP